MSVVKYTLTAVCHIAAQFDMSRCCYSDWTFPAAAVAAAAALS